MIKIPLNYDIKKDINTFLEAEHIDMAYLSEVTKISRVTLDGIINEKNPTNDNVYEKFYSYLYTNGYRLNKTKEELLKERTPNILFHGSKEGLKSVSIDGARKNCDFGNGFYLGETYFQALAFIYEKDHSSIYSFSYRREDLNIKRFECDLEWMLAICYHRGTLQNYKGHPLLQKILRSLDDIDLIIAPIANNRMFYIMSQFVEGEINADVALHSLSASSLGLQYIFRSEKALQSLSAIEKYYVSLPERKSCKKLLNERALMIDTKLKLAKREYKSGLYIEEILK